MLENVGEELDPLLEPLLLKQTFKQGGSICIKLGDSVIEYSKDFRSVRSLGLAYVVALAVIMFTVGYTERDGQGFVVCTLIISCCAVLVKFFSDKINGFHTNLCLTMTKCVNSFALCRFYITTKLRNPHYLPETSVKASN